MDYQVSRDNGYYVIRTTSFVCKLCANKKQRGLRFIANLCFM
jgi:hypothetical protein